MHSHIDRVQTAIADLRQGKMIILIDDPHRENEGDIIFPAEIITPHVINFMIRHCSGIICLPLSATLANQLKLPFMVAPHENASSRGTPFTVSIEAKAGVTTGVSAADRAHTILTAVKDGATAEDLVSPGHIFPLVAKSGGVLERAGHTEGAIDLVKFAGFKSAAVLCEVMNPDGSMASGARLAAFAEEHQITMLTIEDLVAYRYTKENLILEEASATLPLQDYGDFTITVIREAITHKEHIILEKQQANKKDDVLVRIHSCCITGDLFGSKRCDCNQQLQYSLKRIAEVGGILIYLNQEGRGIGLLNKIKAYALQEQGLDTVDANLELGLPVDSRHYHIAANVLRNRGITKVRLLTNNPAKVVDLQKFGITHITQETLPLFCNKTNQHYLATKQNKLNHMIDMIEVNA